MSSGRRYYSPSTAVLVVVAVALASCTDAATVMLKMKDIAGLRPKGAIVGVESSTAAAASIKDNSEGFNLDAHNYTNVANITDDDDGSDDETLSAVWYLAAFGGLVLFFFVVTCSELFFGNPIYTRRPVELPHAGYLRRHVYGLRNPQNHHRGGHYAPETPPPPYHLFAPPSYDDTVKGGLIQHHHQYAHHHLHHHHEPGTKKLADVYVVPVHTAACTAAATAAAAATVTDAKMQQQLAVLTKFK